MLLQTAHLGNHRGLQQPRCSSRSTPTSPMSWEVSEDGLDVGLQDPRRHSQWSDGTPFTCADAKWSFDSHPLRRGPEPQPAGAGLQHRQGALRRGVRVRRRPDADRQPRPAKGGVPRSDVDAVPHTCGRSTSTRTTPTSCAKTPARGRHGTRSRSAQWLPGESYTWERRAGLLEPAVPVRGRAPGLRLRDEPRPQRRGLPGGQAGRLPRYRTAGRADTLLSECRPLRLLRPASFDGPDSAPS